MEQNDITISARDVAMRFRLTDDKILSLKEFVTRKIRGKIKTNEFWALKGVSFDVHKGEVLGIIGRNGSGKSTLLKCISGILKPTRGSVTCHGNIVPMLELGSGFDPDLTGRENVFLNGAILGYTEEFLKEKFDEIHEFSELGDFIDVPIRNYSSGMMARLAFSVATVVNPQILIVDEILSVGDESFQTKSRARMMELMSGGTTVLFVSHSLSQIRDRRGYVLAKLFATTGLSVSDLPVVTVEAAEAGRLVKGREIVRFSEGLQTDLLEYAKESGRLTGTIFTQKNGTPLMRTQVSVYIQKLGQDARIPVEKANVRALRQLHKAAVAAIEANFDLLVQQAYERQLEVEEVSAGW